MRHQLEKEIERFNRFQHVILEHEKIKPGIEKVDIRAYAKYLLCKGSIDEKKELLANLKNRLSYQNGRIVLHLER